MPYFQDSSGALHFLSAIDVTNGGKSLLPVGCTQITDEAAAAIQSPPVALAQVKSDQSAMIDAAYASTATQSVSFKTAAGVTQTFQADSDSQDVLLKAVQGYTTAGAVPTGFFWKSADNTLVTFTLADLQGLYETMLAQGWGAFQKRVNLKAEIAAATTVAAVQAITWV